MILTDSTAVPDPLISVVSERLSAVTFVTDYIQLAFDGPVLTVLNPLTILSAGEAWDRTRLGWRDTLCSLIGRVVENVAIKDCELTIDLDAASSIRISLHPSDYHGPEAFEFKLPGGETVVG